ncbi:MAG: intersectin-EH binding protein Ibp1 [Mycobacterium sp.]|nr:intersectin-EH binding protein Ibp1 [Mycobacterium sp.]
MALHTLDTSVTSRTRRLLLAGCFAAALAAAPVVVAATSAQTAPAGPALATCPPGETLDTASGACKPNTDNTPTTTNPLNPESAALQPGGLTNSEAGNVGSLPEVNGVPCTGAGGGGGGTGNCIGLSENQDNYEAPRVSVNGQSVSPTP